MVAGADPSAAAAAATVDDDSVEPADEADDRDESRSAAGEPRRCAFAATAAVDRLRVP